MIWLVLAPLVEADKETNEKNYQLWRIENGVAEGSTEIPKGAYFFFHEFDLLSALNHITLFVFSDFLISAFGYT